MARSIWSFGLSSPNTVDQAERMIDRALKLADEGLLCSEQAAAITAATGPVLRKDTETFLRQALCA